MAVRTWSTVGCEPNPVRHQVAPAAIHGSGSVPVGLGDDEVEGLALFWTVGSQPGDLGHQSGERVRTGQIDREQPVDSERPGARVCGSASALATQIGIVGR